MLQLTVNGCVESWSLSDHFPQSSDDVLVYKTINGKMHPITLLVVTVKLGSSKFKQSGSYPVVSRAPSHFPLV